MYEREANYANNVFNSFRKECGIDARAVTKLAFYVQARDEIYHMVDEFNEVFSRQAQNKDFQEFVYDVTHDGIKNSERTLLSFASDHNIEAQTAKDMMVVSDTIGALKDVLRDGIKDHLQPEDIKDYLCGFDMRLMNAPRGLVDFVDISQRLTDVVLDEVETERQEYTNIMNQFGGLVIGATEDNPRYVWDMAPHEGALTRIRGLTPAQQKRLDEAMENYGIGSSSVVQEPEIASVPEKQDDDGLELS